MILSLIAAIGKNNELGKGNTLLWHIPADMQYFRDTTSGHTVIMGRKTFESLPGGPLPKRRNIVITRDKTYLRHSVDVVHSLEEAIEQVKNEGEAFVIGGAEIYKQSISKANKLYITHIDASDIEADSFFPSIGLEWQEKSRQSFPADDKNPYAYSFITYKKN
jgi:dihydrofolate reductase